MPVSRQPVLPGLAAPATVPDGLLRVYSRRKGAPPHPKDAVYVGLGTPWGNEPYRIPRRRLNCPRWDS